MKSIEILSKISERQVLALMFHEQMADYYDFLGLHGYKRMHEYHYLKESSEMRATHRYCINHCDHLIERIHVDNPKILPISWNGISRFQINPELKRKAIIEGFERYHKFTKENKEIYSGFFKELTTDGEIATANKVNELVKCYDCELKIIERKILDLEAIGYDMKQIMLEQHEIHEDYKERTKSIGIFIC